MEFRKKDKIADFFLNEAHPYSKKRSINGTHVGLVFAVLVLLVLGVGSYLDAKANAEHAQELSRREAEKNSKVSADPTNGRIESKGYLDLLASNRSHQSNKPRENSASQIIKRGNSVSDVLPMGTVVRVKLLGKVESADANSPVNAVVVQSAMSPAGFEVIPVGTKVIGQGQIDPARERLVVRFHTLVYPEGDQFTISAQAAMPDGSSGLAGDFSSGSFKRHASQFAGNFIGGMADGMKDRATGGGIGIPFEPGSLKNGALNGVAQSSLDYAKTSSEDMGKVQATMSLASGEEFNLYLEREFHQ